MVGWHRRESRFQLECRRTKKIGGSPYGMAGEPPTKQGIARRRTFLPVPLESSSLNQVKSVVACSGYLPHMEKHRVLI
jgi:hypothetical protein